jgi:hypothetical protein
MEPEVKDPFTDPVTLSTAVSSLASTAGPCTPNSQTFKPIVGMANSQSEWLPNHERADTADSEQSIFDSIAGFYIPSNMN